MQQAPQFCLSRLVLLFDTQTRILLFQTLVKEKNRELAKADERLQDVRRSSLREVDADRAKIKGLTDKSFQDHGVAIDRLRDATSGIEKTQNQAGISFRISKNEKEFAACPSDIEKTCEGLEKKLKESNAAREQAENRCSKALCELEQQKADIITLAAQLQEASSGGGGLNMLDKENQIEGKKLLNSLFKEGDRLRGLKGALVKLKTQFVAAEEVFISVYFNVLYFRSILSNRRLTQLLWHNLPVPINLMVVKKPPTFIKRFLS